MSNADDTANLQQRAAWFAAAAEGPDPALSRTLRDRPSAPPSAQARAVAFLLDGLKRLAEGVDLPPWGAPPGGWV